MKKMHRGRAAPDPTNKAQQNSPNAQTRTNARNSPKGKPESMAQAPSSVKLHKFYPWRALAPAGFQKCAWATCFRREVLSGDPRRKKPPILESPKQARRKTQDTPSFIRNGGICGIYFVGAGLRPTSKLQVRKTILQDLWAAAATAS